MEKHFKTLNLSMEASLVDARTAFYNLVTQYSPGKVSGNFEGSDPPQQCTRLADAWKAIQEYFFAKDGIPSSKWAFQWVYTDAELLMMAKRDQLYRREQPRGPVQVRGNDNLPAGLYEEYERLRIHNLGYVFDGEASVFHSIGMDVFTGEPTFTTSIFKKYVNFRPERKLRSSEALESRLKKPASQRQGPPTVTFLNDTVFEEDVEFHLAVVFTGGVIFKKKVIFKSAATFNEKPVYSTYGAELATIRRLYND